MLTFEYVEAKIITIRSEGNIWISRSHIEKRRPWREIYVADVHEVLEKGQLSEYGPKQAWWVGLDITERQISLLLKAQNELHQACTWENATSFRVKTAVFPEGKQADLERKKEYFRGQNSND